MSFSGVIVAVHPIKLSRAFISVSVTADPANVFRRSDCVICKRVLISL